MNKRKYFILTLTSIMIVMSILISGCSSSEKVESKDENKTIKEQVYSRPDTVNYEDAKKLLEEGNDRYVKSMQLKKDLSSNRREELAKGQKPFAVVVTCSDSRVPPELIFDQALGDLFVVRVAGNVIDPVTLGSVEYAVEHLKAPYLVVMGHEKCGAVKATVDGGVAPGSIGAIVDLIKPSVAKEKAKGLTGDQLVEESANENVTAMIAKIKESKIIKELEETKKLEITGAKYHLGSGKVEWLNNK